MLENNTYVILKIYYTYTNTIKLVSNSGLTFNFSNCIDKIISTTRRSVIGIAMMSLYLKTDRQLSHAFIVKRGRGCG